jgi:Kef-type K+ transport system membrane component KefB
VTIPLLLALAIVIAAAKVGAWISKRLGQPAVLGELAVGLLLGPSVLNLFGLPYFEAAHTTETLHEFGELGVILLMFAAGLEVRVSDLRRTGKPAVFVGVAGVIVPILMGLATALVFGYGPAPALFIGLVLSATSVSISAQTLIEIGQLRSYEGLTLLNAAVVDDVLAIVLLSIFSAFALEGVAGGMAVVWTIARMGLFLVGALLIGMFLLPRAVRIAEGLRVSESLLSFTLVGILVFAWASDALGGIATITGAFIAGVALSNSSLKDEIERGIHTLTYAFFVPIFLVSIGLAADARALSTRDIGLTVAIVIVAVASKWVGAGSGARLGGMSRREASRVGAGMISRGEVGLIIAGLGVTSGVFQSNVYTAVVVMVLATTLIAPVLLRFTFRDKEITYGTAGSARPQQSGQDR